MKVSHEVPFCLLELSKQFNDYQYCLPHLMDQNQQYRDFFLQCKQEGIEIFLDNSLHELGHSYDEDRLLYWVNELKPSTFFVPDVWEDKNSSIENAEKWIDIELPEGVEKVAVIQARYLNEVIECYNEYKSLGYNKIAFSYGNGLYRDLFLNVKPSFSKMYGRIYVIKRLIEEEIIQPKDRIHLLGCQLPQEFKHYKDIPQIESIDTSSPIMAALSKVPLTKNGLLKKPRRNLNTTADIDINKVNIDLVIHNVKKFREINGLKPIE